MVQFACFMQRRVWAADGARVARTPFEIFIRYSHKSDRAAFYEDLCRLLSDVPFYYSLTAVPQKIRFLGKLEQPISIYSIRMGRQSTTNFTFVTGKNIINSPPI